MKLMMKASHLRTVNSGVFALCGPNVQFNE
jgi:hypothetical protein